MANGANLILEAVQPTIAAARPYSNFVQGVQDQNTLASQGLNNQLLQQQLTQNAAINPLQAQLMQQRVDAGQLDLQNSQEMAPIQLQQAQQQQLMQGLTSIAREGLAMPQNQRLQHIKSRLSTVDFMGLDEQELIAELDMLPPEELTKALENMVAQSQGQGMSEYQRENLRIQEERLRQQEEKNQSLTPYQQSQLDQRAQKIALDEKEFELKRKQREYDLAGEEDKKRLAKEKAELSKQQSRERAALVSGDLDRAMNLAGTMTTGFLGARTKGVEGTESYDLAQVLDGIKANIGFTELNAMRQSSPTGGALGNVTERELELLQRTVGSLEQQQSKEQFLYNAKRAKVLFDSIVNGTNAVIFTQKQYESLPSGSTYIDPDDGRVYRKP